MRRRVRARARIGRSRAPTRGARHPRRSPARRGGIAAALALGLALASPIAAAHADEPVGVTPAREPLAVQDREIGARVGLASGGGAGVTPGGLRVSGYYLYQLADVDWFEGAVSFTFGSGGARCFRDRQDERVCDHGAFDGFAGELTGGVRRFVMVRGDWAPYLRASVGARVASFADDDLRGFAIPVAAGAGVRVRVDDRVAVGADAALEAGFGWFGRGLGGRPQAGLLVGLAVDFALE